MNEDYLEIEKKYIAPTYGSRGLIIEKGEGVILPSENISYP